MRSVFAVLRKYYQIFVILWAILVGVGLDIGNRRTAEHWLLGIVALAMCLPPLQAQWIELRSGRYGLNILPVTAIVTAVVIKLYWTAIVLALVVAGTKVLQDYARRRATKELAELSTEAPRTAHILRGRKIVDVAVADIQKNYKLLIEPGETVPVDAVVLDGSGSFDESLLTGDNLPQKKFASDFIMSGSVNLGGAVKVKALESATHSTYEKITKMLRSASVNASHAPLSRRAETVTIPFTLVALGIAGAAWIFSGHATRFLEVLSVGTTMPLLWAASLALTAGVGLSARYGVFVKSARALEYLSRTRTAACLPTEGSSFPTKSSLKQLKELGVAKVLAITESQKAANKKSLERLGATEVRVAQSSGDKLRVIEQAAQRPIIFVSSEAESSLLLAAADVGIELDARSRSNEGTADVVIMRSDPQLVVTSLAIAKRAARIARQSTWAGAGLSLALMILFFFGFVPSLAGVLIQAALNFLVVVYALRAHSSNSY